MSEKKLCNNLENNMLKLGENLVKQMDKNGSLPITDNTKQGLSQLGTMQSQFRDQCRPVFCEKTKQATTQLETAMKDPQGKIDVNVKNLHGVVKQQFDKYCK